MIDVRLLRESPDEVRAAVAKKKFDCDVDRVIELDEARRSAITGAEQARARQKSANQEMAALAKGSPEFQEKVKEMKAIAAEAKELEAAAKSADEAFREALLTVPNLPDPDVPVGDSEAHNRVVDTWGDAGGPFPDALPHFDLPWFASRVDFARGAKVTGAGFPFYNGEMARFQRAMIAFFLDEAAAAGYGEIAPPLLVNADSATATGQLPDKEGQMYSDAEEGVFLIPTAEVPVTNYYRDEILEAAELPIARCAHTPCFRREAGSWGAHVRGLNRLHQFDKVELVKWTAAEQSAEELESLRGDVERVLRKLELPYRVLLMCTGDIGFPHARQYDLEVFAAGQERWLEVSSCSNFTDFQARRAGIRYRGPDGKPRIAHTLNGSGLAVPRVLAAILENNRCPDGKVRVPDCLRGYLGQDFLGEAG